MTKKTYKHDADKQLQDQVNHIAKQIETVEWWDAETSEDERGAFDYLKDVLDIRYVVSSKREYIAARILVAFGGPNIWINTETKTVEGYWWSSKAEAHYYQDNIGLDEALEELFNC